MFLTPEELVELTHAKQRGTQARALCMMGIEHKLRPDGSIAVLRGHVEKIFGGVSNNEKTKSIKRTVLDLAALEEWQRQVAERRKKK